MELNRTISVSTSVFARIWALREPGEETENAILCRVLGISSTLKTDQATIGSSGSRSGFHDSRHGVSFSEGFKVFRRFRGENRTAFVSEGCWVLDDGRKAQSLNQLSRLIGALTENAWLGWMYLDERGRRQPITNLRKKELIENPSDQNGLPGERMTWRDDVLEAMKELGRVADLAEIYRAVRSRRLSANRTLPPSTEEIIRRTLEENCAETESYKGMFNLFRMPEGKGAGKWALR